MTKVKAQISNECQMTNAKKYVLRLKVPWFTVQGLLMKTETTLNPRM
jgi:hypothetical protein